MEKRTFFFLFNFLILLVLRTRGTLLVSSVLAARVWKVLLRGPQLGQISRFLFHSSLVSGPIVDSRLFKLTLNKTNFQVDKLAETHISLVFTLNCIAMVRSCKRDSRSKTHCQNNSYTLISRCRCLKASESRDTGAVDPLFGCFLQVRGDLLPATEDFDLLFARGPCRNQPLSDPSQCMNF